MRFYTTILLMLLSSILFSQTYGYDKEYQKQLEKSGVEITDKQKEKVRSDIKKWANFYLDNPSLKHHLHHPCWLP